MGGESGDQKRFATFHEDPNRFAADLGRLILGGLSTRARLVFADVRIFQTRGHWGMPRKTHSPIERRGVQDRMANNMEKRQEDTARGPNQYTARQFGRPISNKSPHRAAS